MVSIEVEYDGKSKGGSFFSEDLLGQFLIVGFEVCEERVVELFDALAGVELRQVRVVELVDDDGGVEDAVCALLEDQGDVALGAEDVAQVHRFYEGCHLFEYFGAQGFHVLAELELLLAALLQEV